MSIIASRASLAFVASVCFMVGCTAAEGPDTGDRKNVPISETTPPPASGATASKGCPDDSIAVGDACEKAPGQPYTGPGSSLGVVAGPPPVYREVFGYPQYLCGDRGEIEPGKDQTLTSSWYLIAQGVAYARDYVGTCASLSTDPARAAYKEVEGWAGFKCADLPVPDSMWFKIGDGVRTATRKPGPCASYARTAAPAGWGAWRPVAGVPNWLCADPLGTDNRSLWWYLPQSVTTAAVYNGRCDSYAR